MICNKCGKEIPEGATCDCSTQPEKKKKSKLKTLLMLSPIIAFLVIAILLSFGGEENSNNLGFTLAEFVERYNETVDIHLIDDQNGTYKDVQGMLKLDVEYFSQVEDEGLKEDGVIAYFASNNNFLNYYVLMDDSGEKVRLVSFEFPSTVTEAQLDLLLSFCKWFAEAVEPEMGEDYYTDALVEAIENGEARRDGTTHIWEKANGFYSYQICYAA